MAVRQMCAASCEQRSSEKKEVRRGSRQEREVTSIGRFGSVKQLP